MKDLRKLVAECETDLASLGIQCGSVSDWQINTRAKHRWGLCKRNPDGSFLISISAALLIDSVSDQAAKNTILHELLHTVPGCFSHTEKWLRLANKVNHRLPHYTIKRTTSAEEKGIAPGTPNYLLKCKGCGTEFGRDRLSPLVRQPEKYLCSRCGHSLYRVR